MVATAPFRFDLLESEQNSFADRLRCLTLASGAGGRLDFVFVRPAPTAPDASAKAGHTRLFLDEGDTSVTISEISAGGSVPTLRAKNDHDTDVLLLAGQIVRGGKQNRGLNADILIEAGKWTEIPVTCVEQGRWSGDPSSRFRHAGIEPLSIRSSKMRGVHHSIRASGSHDADQGEVWSKVASMQRAMAVESRSSDLLESLDAATTGRRSRLITPRFLQDASSADAPTPARDRAEVLLRDPRLPMTMAEELRRLRDAISREAQLAGRPSRALLMAVHHAELALLEAQVARLEEESRMRFRGILELRRQFDRLVMQASEHLASLPADAPVAPDGVTQDAMQQADAEARESAGALVFLDGEFLTGDLFADRSWFARFYGDLCKSAIASWRELEANAIESGRRRATKDIDDAAVLARAASVLRDTSAGHWREGKAPGHGKLWMLEHPFLESSATTGRGDEALHILVGTRHEPEVFRHPRAPMRAR